MTTTTTTKSTTERKVAVIITCLSLIYVDHIHCKGKERMMTIMLLPLLPGGCMRNDANDLQWDSLS